MDATERGSNKSLHCTSRRAVVSCSARIDLNPLHLVRLIRAYVRIKTAARENDGSLLVGNIERAG